MLGAQQDGARPSLLRNTLKAVVAIGVLSVAAAEWLSVKTKDHVTLSRLAGNASKGVEDPLTTGSVEAKAAGAARLDPCSTPRR